jgi:hypothetical protein
MSSSPPAFRHCTHDCAGESPHNAVLFRRAVMHFALTCLEGAESLEQRLVRGMCAAGALRRFAAASRRVDLYDREHCTEDSSVDSEFMQMCSRFEVAHAPVSVFSASFPGHGSMAPLQ